jgi:hypothetical protein
MYIKMKSQTLKNKKMITTSKIIPHLLTAAMLVPSFAGGQGKKIEYIPKVKSRIEITGLPGSITLQNAAGNVIVLESDFNLEQPERAKGLQLLGAGTDNTGIGLHLEEENGIVRIQGIVNQVKDNHYTITTPAPKSLCSMAADRKSIFKPCPATFTSEKNKNGATAGTTGHEAEIYPDTGVVALTV